MSTNLADQDLTTVQDIIIEQLGVTREQLTPGAELMRDLGADSLDVMEIGMTIESEFNLTIPDEHVEKMNTVGDVYEVLGKLRR
jgi:acyl carrier protein